MAENRNSKTKNSQSRRTRRRKIVLLVCFAICVYFVISILSIQIDIYKEKQKLNDLRGRIGDVQLENDELSRIVNGAGEAEYIERIAREKLGYAAPDERVFEDVAGSVQETTGGAGTTDTAGAGSGAQTPADTGADAAQQQTG